MSAKAESWQTAEIAGPQKANVIVKPEIAAAIIKRAKRPIIVVGYLSTKTDKDTGKMIEYVISMNKACGIPVVATAHTIKEFVKQGIALTNDLYYYPKHWIRSGSSHDLQSICRRIIADFDSQILQKRRDILKEDRIFNLDK